VKHFQFINLLAYTLINLSGSWFVFRIVQNVVLEFCHNSISAYPVKYKPHFISLMV